MLQGTFRQDRHGTAPHVDTKWPAAPAFLRLTARQAELWESLKDGDSWHAQTDWPAVWGLVLALDELLLNHAAQAETDTSGHPLAYKHIVKHAMDAGGQPVELEIVSAEENPLKTNEMKWLDKVYKFIALNGYSPVDRARMPKAGEVEQASPLDRFIKKAQ